MSFLEKPVLPETRIRVMLEIPPPSSSSSSSVKEVPFQLLTTKEKVKQVAGYTLIVLGALLLASLAVNTLGVGFGVVTLAGALVMGQAMLPVSLASIMAGTYILGLGHPKLEPSMTFGPVKFAS